MCGEEGLNAQSLTTKLVLVTFRLLKGRACFHFDFTPPFFPTNGFACFNSRLWDPATGTHHRPTPQEAGYRVPGLDFFSDNSGSSSGGGDSTFSAFPTYETSLPGMFALVEYGEGHPGFLDLLEGF